MVPGLVVRVVGGVAAGVLLVSGCGSADDPPATSGSSSGSVSASPSASASGTGTPAAGTSQEAAKRATAATRKALLPTAAFKKIGLDVADKPKTDKWDWFETCNPTLPSESRQVTGTNGTWDKDGLVVSQTVVAYPDGVAEDVVAEVAKAVDCSTYSANGHEYSKVKALDLPEVAAADAKHAWCMVEAEEDVTVCHSVLAAQDLVSSLWVRSGSAEEAKDGMAALTLLAAERIKAQIR
jgi:hypothetical protein